MSHPTGRDAERSLSIVVPVYYNELNLPETVPQLLALESRLPGIRLELVFVDDGSKDRSLELLLGFQATRPETITVVQLTRNFGSMAAILAGFEVAGGDCVAMISADLQDPPELLVEMVRHWMSGSKAVFAVRADREDALPGRLFASLYYTLVRRYALPDYPSGGFDFFLVDRQVARQLVEIGEKNTNLMSLVYWLGFAAVTLPYVRRRRRKGQSRWTPSKKLKLFIDSFVAFSYVPIRFLSVVGLVVATAAFAYAGVVLYSWAVHGIPVRGFAPIVIVLAFTAGIQMLMLGVLGEYLWRTLDETRRRPPYVVDRVYARNGLVS